MYVALARRDEHVDEVVGLFAAPVPLGWVELFKVFEIVRDEVGGEDRLAATGLALKRRQGGVRVVRSGSRQESP